MKDKDDDDSVGVRRCNIYSEVEFVHYASFSALWLQEKKPTQTCHEIKYFLVDRKPGKCLNFITINLGLVVKMTTVIAMIFLQDNSNS